MEKSTIIVEGTFRDGYEQHFAEYSRKVRMYLDQFGAEVIRRQRVKKCLHGSGAADLIMVIDFPSVEICGNNLLSARVSGIDSAPRQSIY